MRNSERATLARMHKHVLNLPAVAALHNLIDPRFKCTWLPTNSMSPALAAHTGPSMVGVAYAPLAVFDDVP